jgi:CheY-like chemotaxis protein
VTAVVDNGPDAIAHTRAIAPDLVLMDIELRGPMDGTAAARQTRDDFARPVVFVSSNTDPTVLRRAKEAEPYGYVAKPFSEAQFFATIELALHRRQLETERAHLRPAQAAADARLREVRALLPICAGCKKIHEDDGRWTKLEEYFSKHAGIEFTHSFCADCENRLYGTHSRGPIQVKRGKP